MCVFHFTHLSIRGQKKGKFHVNTQIKEGQTRMRGPQKKVRSDLCLDRQSYFPWIQHYWRIKKNWRRKGGEWVAFGETASSLAATNWEIYFDITEKTICLHSRIIFLCKVNPLLLLLLLSNWEIYFTTRSILYKTPFPAALAKK